jgi:hypothetical protein
VIDYKEKENVIHSMRVNPESRSNDIDERGQQYEKHDEQRIRIRI